MYRDRKQIFAWATVFIVGIVQCSLVAPQSVAGAVARGYLSGDDKLRVGMAVALSAGADNKVERASQENQRAAIGIATTIDGSLVTIANSSAQVLVETEGEIDAYITDIGGDVVRGDLLTVSPFKGILMKANASADYVIAIAASDTEFTGAESYDLADASSSSARIIKSRVSLNNASAGTGSSRSTNALSRIGRSITGRDVSEVRVLIALIIFVIVLIAEGGIIYGAISSAVSALGRNPLAGKMIHRELIRVILVAVTVLILGMSAVFVILKI